MSLVTADRLYENSLRSGRRQGPSIREARLDAEAVERAVRRAQLVY